LTVHLTKSLLLLTLVTFSIPVLWLTNLINRNSSENTIAQG
jgi:hypothetical protein